MKPLIGINLDIVGAPPAIARVRSFYYEAIERAGGIPVLVPPMSDAALDQLLKCIDGLLLIGGNDYSPELYGEEPGDKVELINPVRQEFDLRLVSRAVSQTKIPVLGICAGCQILNIACQGSLIQDIATTIPYSPVTHSSASDELPKHTVSLEAGSLIRQIYQADSVLVVSSHHQAIKVPGNGLKVVARAPDGVIEAVELAHRPFVIGVQWHPERDFDANRLLFEQFVKASTKATQ